MPTKRQVLELLKRDELLAAADAYELAVADRRQRALLVDALARSRKGSRRRSGSGGGRGRWAVSDSWGASATTAASVGRGNFRGSVGGIGA